MLWFFWQVDFNLHSNSAKDYYVFCSRDGVLRALLVYYLLIMIKGIWFSNIACLNNFVVIAKLSLQETMYRFLSLVIISSLLVACQHKVDDEWQGYVEGEFTYLAAPFAGTLQNLTVERGAQVKAGNLLFKLDPEPEVSDFQQAEQQLNEAQANLKLAELRLTRAKQLIKHDAAAQDALDEAQTTYSRQLAYLKQAQAVLNKAKWSMGQKAATAPIDALVFDTFYHNGELVAQGQPVLALLAPSHIHVLFYVSESKLALLAVGKKLKLNCDGCSQEVEAQISFISPKAEYTPPVIYSRDNNHKLLFKVEARLLGAHEQLHLGQPVYVKLSKPS